jgi:hypothetical protein
MAHSSKGETSACPCLATQHRAKDGAAVEQTHRQEMTAADLLLELPWHERTTEVERILMVDFATTQARAKGAAPSANYDGG